MLKKILNVFHNFDIITQKIMKSGLSVCFFICIFSVILLLTYDLLFNNPFLYHLGLTIFKLSMIFSIEFIICGYSADLIKKQIT